MKNLLKKIKIYIRPFYKNKEWKKKHMLEWRDELLINKSGLSNFQQSLIHDTKKLLNLLNYSYELKKTYNKNKETKVVLTEIVLIDFDDSSIWIYNDMAEYCIDKTHHIYEEWGYLSPKELTREFIISIEKILSKEQN